MRRSSFNHSSAWVGSGALLAAAVSLLAMMHHPHQASIDGRQNEMLQWTHGILIFTLCIFAFAVQRFANVMAGRRIDPFPGMLFYYIGLGFMLGAALVSGFLQPALTEAFGHDAGAYSAFNRLASALNQVLASASVCFYGAAAIFLSPGLIAVSGKLRLIGFTGLVVGISLILIVAWAESLGVVVMTILTLALAIWHVAVALFLMKETGG